jgi:hypothetical protein
MPNWLHLLLLRLSRRYRERHQLRERLRRLGG